MREPKRVAEIHREKIAEYPLSAGPSATTIGPWKYHTIIYITPEPPRDASSPSFLNPQTSSSQQLAFFVYRPPPLAEQEAPPLSLIDIAVPTIPCDKGTSDIGSASDSGILAVAGDIALESDIWLHSQSMSSYNKNLFCKNNSSFNITNSKNTTHNGTTVNDEELRILSCISPLEPWKRYNDVARARAKGVGEWVLQSSEFQSSGSKVETIRRLVGFCLVMGLQRQERLLFCRIRSPINTQPTTYTPDHGSLIINTFRDETAGRNVTVGCLYCDYRDWKEQTPEVMIGRPLRQFVTALPQILEAIRGDFLEWRRPILGGGYQNLERLLNYFLLC
ncbi:hypothetical protein HOY82DRAFT_620628 [Tuber indicum]|nr:hypothetical protein HOY82DRAFT_620628 [Tuber indicum]